MNKIYINRLSLKSMKKVRITYLGILISIILYSFLFIFYESDKKLECEMKVSISTSSYFHFITIQMLIFSLLVWDSYKRLNNKLAIFSVFIKCSIILLILTFLIYK